MNDSIQSRFDQPADGRAAVATQSPRRAVSNDLLRGDRLLIIEHGEASYRLLLTRNGKLILTK